MNATFNEIQNTQAPKLKTPHFVVDHECKRVEKPFPSVASYIVFVGKSRSGNQVLSHRYLQIDVFIEMLFKILLSLFLNIVFIQ